jgi:response regulator RpfG family c-di-GMP phosphodiesterase
VTEAQATILLVEDDEPTLSALQRLLGAAGVFRVEVAGDGLAGLARARELRPDLILSDLHMPGLSGFEFCREVKADPTLSRATFAIISGTADTAVKVQGLNLGVDDYLTKPVDAAELLAKLHAMLRLKHLNDELHEDKLELRNMHGQLEQSFHQVVALLVRLLDLGLPGVAARSERLAHAALRLGARFEVPLPLVRDLDVAAQLHEIGRVVTPPAGPVHEERAAYGPPSDDWEYVLRSRDVLQHVDRLRGAVEVIAAIYENWDGTGLPDHRRQGEIPLRSRILRVLIDFFTALERGGMGPDAAAGALATVEERAGTWYDGVVVGHLREMVHEDAPHGLAGRRHCVAVDDLEDGMRLADDLYTSSGVKLLARDALLTPAARETISRRHQSDPILGGVWIHESRV